MSRFLIIFLAVLLFAGCSRTGALSQQPPQQKWMQWQQSQQQVNSWDLHARAVVILPGEVYNVGIAWQQDAQGLVILLEAPFGQGVMRVESSSAGPRIYRLSLPDGRVLENDSAEALLEAVIGWSIPIGGLEFWIRGLPRPDSQYRHSADAGGRPGSINQDGWTVGYLDYFDGSQTPGLPRRLQLVHEDVTLKLVIERWQAAEDQRPSVIFPEFN